MIGFLTLKIDIYINASTSLNWVYMLFITGKSRGNPLFYGQSIIQSIVVYANSIYGEI